MAYSKKKKKSCNNISVEEKETGVKETLKKYRSMIDEDRLKFLDELGKWK